ncbi:hypothetical protein CMI37_13875 [Candidatus Pacearchaeota archaeon]|nr:hypothetical protein [Candidatus Pacearchaeota archaeon]|tara:strand:- start:21 stop:407 length:387 start_codon:yes stop_codon:yes gene_type:complete
MAEACTITETQKSNSVKKIKWDWQSASDGSVSASVGETTDQYDGEILAVMTDPDAAGDAPTDNYDIVINDEDSIDVLVGRGANRDTANSEYVHNINNNPLLPVSKSKLTLVISNAGDTKKGLVYLFIR